MESVTWDGNDFASIQMLTRKLRKNGEPYATMDKNWNLVLDGIRVPIGTVVDEDGTATIPDNPAWNTR